MSVYIEIKKNIIELGKERLHIDSSTLSFYTGYITGLRDFDLISKKQCKKLDGILRNTYYGCGGE